MKTAIAIFLLFVPLTVFSQLSDTVKSERQTVYFTKINGDTIRVTGEVHDPTSDTAIISVESVKLGKITTLQNFKLDYYYPLATIITMLMVWMV